MAAARAARSSHGVRGGGGAREGGPANPTSRRRAPAPLPEPRSMSPPSPATPMKRRTVRLVPQFPVKKRMKKKRRMRLTKRKTRNLAPHLKTPPHSPPCLLQLPARRTGSQHQALEEPRDPGSP